MNEKRLAGSSYIINFYNEVQELNHQLAQYLNLLLELESKYNSISVEKATPEEKNTVIQVAQSLRYYMHKVVILYRAIIKGVKKQEDPELIKAYNESKKDLIISRKSAEEFIVYINTVLVQDIIKEILETSQDYVKDIYKDDTV